MKVLSMHFIHIFFKVLKEEHQNYTVKQKVFPTNYFMHF